jgi:beta-glucanase (GH16 family)
MATMFVFRSPRNVHWNEIDLELTPNLHQEVRGNVVNAAGELGYPGGNAGPFSTPGPAGYDITQEHVYAFEWTPTRIEWFLDGASIAVFSGNDQVPIPNLSAKIMMNLWVFAGTAFGPPSRNQYPIEASYDYFHFYKWTGDTSYPCAPTPGCLAPDDKTRSAQNNPLEMNYGQ